jgi:hypothetical protein
LSGQLLVVIQRIENQVFYQIEIVVVIEEKEGDASCGQPRRKAPVLLHHRSSIKVSI